MRKSWINLSVCSFLSLSASAAMAQYKLDQPLKIGGDGRWDYVTIGNTDRLLYVTRSTHTQIIDTESGKVVGDVEAGEKLHGTAVVDKVGKAFVSDGGKGVLIVFDLKTREVLGEIKAADDADGIIYDAGTNLVLTSCGDANVLLSLDPTADVKSAACKSVDLGGKPEFLAADGKGKAYVCVNDKNQIAVVDLKEMKVLSKWPTGTGTEPTGLAIDAKNGRLFVGCHNQKMIVLDTTDGAVLAELPVGDGNDACAFDSKRGVALASCADATMTVVKETSPKKFEVVQTLATKPGARTMNVDEATGKLYLPAAMNGPAAAGGGRPPMIPGSFMILVASPK